MHCDTATQHIVLDFTVKEIVRYQRRYEEGYDIPDPRYEYWITLYHPEEIRGKENSSPSTLSSGVSQPLTSQRGSTSSASSNVHPPQSLFSKFLKDSAPKYKLPAKEPKTSARILTSAESLRILQEKQRKKDEAVAKKEMCKHAREEAKLAKALDAQRKQLLKSTAKGGSRNSKVKKGSAKRGGINVPNVQVFKISNSAFFLLVYIVKLRQQAAIKTAMTGMCRKSIGGCNETYSTCTSGNYIVAMNLFNVVNHVPSNCFDVDVDYSSIEESDGEFGILRLSENSSIFTIYSAKENQHAIPGSDSDGVTASVSREFDFSQG